MPSNSPSWCRESESGLATFVIYFRLHKYIKRAFLVHLDQVVLRKGVISPAQLLRLGIFAPLQSDTKLQ
jgi:hypothetical protein